MYIVTILYPQIGVSISLRIHFFIYSQIEPTSFQTSSISNAHTHTLRVKKTHRSPEFYQLSIHPSTSSQPASFLAKRPEEPETLVRSSGGHDALPRQIGYETHAVVPRDPSLGGGRNRFWRLEAVCFFLSRPCEGRHPKSRIRLLGSEVTEDVGQEPYGA